MEKNKTGFQMEKFPPRDREISGAEIRAARKRLGLSQLEAAERADVSRRTLQHAESGSHSVKSSSIKAIAEALQIDDVQAEVEDVQYGVANLDSFLYWPFRMFEFVRSSLATDPLAFCEDEEDFLSALERVWRNRCNPAKLTELHPALSTREGFIDRYLGIWRACPKSFSFSSSAGERTGMSIALPVGETTYRSFLAGRISNFAIQGSEVLPASNTIIYEALASYTECRQGTHRLNATLGFISLNQLAHLFPNVLNVDCDLASFAAREDNVRRMRRAGLAPVGTKIIGYDLPIWQSSNRDDISTDENEELRASTSFHFLSLRQKSLSIRRKFMFRAIAELQKNRAVLTEIKKRRTA